MSANSGGARASWSGKWAFILAAAASAIGLGNLWRFPYLAAKYGGGVFLITYVVLVVTFGFTLMMLEAALGRKTGQSALGAFKSFGKKYAFIGIFTSAIPFIIVPYYCIIGGWVLKYAGAYLIDGSAALADGGTYFTNFIGGGGESFIWAIAFLLIVFAIVALGVKNGIERANRILMPVLLIMTAGICIYELTLPGAIDGLAYYLTPDFSKFSVELVIAALGQMFYSLSLAMGIMITYGSYVKPDVDLNRSIHQIEFFDTGVALLAGVMIVPAVYVFSGTEGMGAGPSLMFISLPKVFDAMGFAGTVVGVLFFVSAIFATLTSCISVLEAITANCMEIFHTSRKKTVLVLSVIYLAASAVIALGYSVFYFEVQLPNGSAAQLLDIMDYISNSVMMPLISLLSTILIGWVLKPQFIVEEMEKGSGKFTRKALYTVIIRYVAPIVMLILFLQSTGILA